MVDRPTARRMARQAWHRAGVQAHLADFMDAHGALTVVAQAGGLETRIRLYTEQRRDAALCARMLWQWAARNVSAILRGREGMAEA